MKRNTLLLAPFRWMAIGLLAALCGTVLVVSGVAIGVYCLATRKDPRDYVNFQL